MWALLGDERVMISGYFAAAFDLLNVRDLDLIEQAATRCEHLVVGVFSDDLVEERLGRRPVVPADERIRLVAGLRRVDHVQLHNEWPEGHGTTFASREDADLVESRPAVILETRRESKSETLREALASAAMWAVA